MKRIALFLFLILSTITCFAQTQIDPTYQIAWNLLSGAGAPTITCTQNGNFTVYPYGAQWGESYQDTTNNVEYKCTTSGWVQNLSTTGGTINGSLNVSGTVAAATAFYGQAAATSVITPMLVVGQGSTPFYGNIISSRTVSGANLFFDDIQAESSFTCTGGSCGYAAHDGRSNINASGGGVMNHALSFQASLTINAPASAIYGMDSQNVINAAVTELDDVHIYDWSGSGSVANHHGIQIDSWTNPGFSIYDAGNTGNYLGSPTQFGSTATFSGTAFNGVVFPGGGFLTLDSAGHLTPNPNLQITNGVISMIDNTAAEILATGAATLTLQSTNTNIAINPVGTNIATFNSQGLTLAANKGITFSGTGSFSNSGQNAGGSFVASASPATYPTVASNMLSVNGLQAYSSAGGGAVSTLFIQPSGGATFIGGSININSLKASSGYNCLQIDSTGTFANTGSPCGTATSTANLAGGAVGSLPYQSAASTTTFIASPTTSGHTFIPVWQPSGSAIAPTAVDANTLSVSAAANSTTTSAISGMSAGGAAIAGSAGAITSSKALAGAGAGITTGPTTSVSGDVMTASGTGGQIADSGTLLSSLAPLASPSFTTPTLGVATATSVNKVAVTAPATSATLTLAQGSTLQTTGAYTLNLTTTGTATPTFPAATDTVVELTQTQTLTNKSIAGSEINSGTIPIAQIPTGTTSSTVPTGGVITAAGPIGSATSIPVVTYNAAGQLTAVTTAMPTVSVVAGDAPTGGGSYLPTSPNTSAANGLVCTSNTSFLEANCTALPTATTATTQSANDNSTKVSTTAYADTHMVETGGTWSPGYGGITYTGSSPVLTGVYKRTSDSSGNHLVFFTVLITLATGTSTGVNSYLTSLPSTPAAASNVMCTAASSSLGTFTNVGCLSSPPNLYIPGWTALTGNIYINGSYWE